MSYTHLPVEERIKMASEYVLLLTGDAVSEEDIITELRSQFSLTGEQAFIALSRTRTVHKELYDQTLKGSITKGVVGIFVGIVCGFFYIAIGEGLGVIAVVIGVIFLFLSFLNFTVVVQKLLDKFFYSPTLIERRLKAKKPGHNNRDWTVDFFLFSFFISIMTLFLHLKKSGFENPDKLITIHGLKIRDSPIKKSTRGKNVSDYYRFSFLNFSNEFRFYETYYKYAEKNFQPELLKTGDTLSFQLRRGDYYDNLDFVKTDDRIDIINLIINNNPIIDLASRNKDKLRLNKNLFVVSIGLLLISFLSMIYRHKHFADKDRRQGLTVSPTFYS